MKKTLYIKYNANRNRKFQTRTEIIEEDGKRFVKKSPLSDEAKAFINNFNDKYIETSSLYKKINALPVEISGGAAYYPLLSGKSLDSLLKLHLSDKEDFLHEIKGIFEKYYVLSDGAAKEFKPDEKFHEIFGDSFDEKIIAYETPCIYPANLDMIFDNVILMDDGSATLFDYEWTFDISCPVFYINFRILSHIYDKYFSIVSKWMDFEDFVLEFGISKEEFSLSLELEKKFMSHIYSGGERALTEKYIYNRSVSLQEIKDSFFLSEEELPKAREMFSDTLNKLNTAVAEINSMQNSKSWKITKPLRKVTNGVRKVKNRFSGEGVVHGTLNHFTRKRLEKNGYNLIRSKAELEKERKYEFKSKVKISVLTPLYNTPVAFLKEMIESVLSQTYSDLELVLIDFSPKENTEVENVVREYQKNDERVIYERSEKNIGIAENTNLCAARATGDYFAILDHDDVLHPSAFFEVMKEIEKGADFIYTDEIKFSESIEHPYEPNYKPDFSYEQLQTQNYICHLNVYSRKLFNDVCGYRSGFNGSQDHDIVLRLTEKAVEISHIPMILYYWRVHEKSVASNIDAKPYATISGIKAIDESYEREGLPFKVEPTFGNIPRYRIITPDFMEGSIAVIIWGNRDREDYLRTIENLKEKADRKCILILPEDIGISEETLGSEKFEVKYIESGFLKVKAISDLNIKKISERFISDYILTVFAGITISGEKCFSEYLSLLSSKEISAVDSMIFYKKADEERIFSGGAYFTGKKKKPVALRGTSMVKQYEGFQADFTHVRAVSLVTNILTMYKKSHIGTENQKYLWTPFVYGTADENGLKEIDISQGYIKIPEREPYFSSEVVKNNLE